MAQLFVSVLFATLQLFSFIALGILIGKLKFWTKENLQALSRFLLTFALPAFLFSRIIKTDISFLKKSLIFPLTALFSISLCLAIAYLIGGIFKIKSRERRTVTALSGFGNSGYLPLALIEILPLSVPIVADKFDPAVSALYVGGFVLVFSPFFWSVGNYLACGTKRKFRLKDFISPPFVGVSLAFLAILFGISPVLQNNRLPFYYILKAAERLGDATFPLALINLGAMIAMLEVSRSEAKGHLLYSLLPLFMRFIFLPSIFFLVFIFVLLPNKVEPAICWVLFLESITPPGTNFSIMAGRSGENTSTISIALLTTYLSYIVIFPAALLLFLSFF